MEVEGVYGCHSRTGSWEELQLPDVRLRTSLSIAPKSRMQFVLHEHNNLVYQTWEKRFYGLPSVEGWNNDLCYGEPACEDFKPPQIVLGKHGELMAQNGSFPAKLSHIEWQHTEAKWRLVDTYTYELDPARYESCLSRVAGGDCIIFIVDFDYIVCNFLTASWELKRNATASALPNTFPFVPTKRKLPFQDNDDDDEGSSRAKKKRG